MLISSCPRQYWLYRSQFHDVQVPDIERGALLFDSPYLDPVTSFKGVGTEMTGSSDQC
jgi:hypothetical protein